jgi:single-strand DNA-binding protein
MSDLHRLMLIGHLGGDLIGSATPSGVEVANVSIAVTDKWRDSQTGEQREKTTWCRLAFWGKRAEIATRYMRKGMQIYAAGPVVARAYMGKDGKPGASLEMNVQEFQMLGGRGAGDERQRDTDTQPSSTQQQQPETGGGFQDDDIPF